MPHCTHDHPHDQADKYTNLATGGEAIASFVSDAYWLAGFFDAAAGFAPEVIGLSYYGLGFGIIMGALSAGGAAYCHRKLNTHHQSSTAEVVTQHRHHNQRSSGRYLALNGGHSESRGLSVMQKTALVGDFISHAGDIAGPMTFVAALASSQYNLSRSGSVVIQSVASLFGGVCSIANVRTCKNVMSAQRRSRVLEFGVGQ